MKDAHVDDAPATHSRRLEQGTVVMLLCLCDVAVLQDWKAQPDGRDQIGSTSSMRLTSFGKNAERYAFRTRTSGPPGPAVLSRCVHQANLRSGSKIDAVHERKFRVRRAVNPFFSPERRTSMHKNGRAGLDLPRTAANLSGVLKYSPFCGAKEQSQMREIQAPRHSKTPSIRVVACASSAWKLFSCSACLPSREDPRRTPCQPAPVAPRSR